MKWEVEGELKTIEHELHQLRWRMNERLILDILFRMFKVLVALSKR